jgi:hypothetical protein
VEQNSVLNVTRTSDSAGGVRTITARGRLTPARAEILLRHPTSQRWCSAGGAWVEERARAVRFVTNLDALVYCEALGVSGMVVAFDEAGRRIYELSVARMLAALSEDPRFQSARAGRYVHRWECPDRSH